MPQNPIKSMLTESLRERLEKYRSQKEQLRAYLKADPSGPAREIEANRQVIAGRIEELEKVFGEISPHIRKMRGRIGEMTDQTNMVACYFLFGKIAQGMRAIFLLARGGFHYEIMEIVRSNREALDLAILFLREPTDSTALKKWFDGEIVENEKAREAMAAFVKDFNQKSGTNLPIEDMKAGIYGGLSKYTHVSYGALLDSYNVYADDFDFEQSAGFHYVKTSSLPYVRGELEGLLLGLKHFYLTTEDEASYRDVDNILRTFAPRLYDEAYAREAAGETRRRMSGPTE